MKQESINKRAFKRAFFLAICFAILLTVGTVSALALSNGGQYALQTSSGNYLTAVGGGGRITDVIHSDATQIKAWETFTVVSLGHKKYALKTYSGNYLTAVGGGGRITDVIHSDATLIKAWETFTIVTLGHNKYALKTYSGNYLTAVGGGGRITDVIHSDATQIKAWETFTFHTIKQKR